MRYSKDLIDKLVSEYGSPLYIFDEDAFRANYKHFVEAMSKEYDKYLKYLYGDYMEMIPVSRRHVSHDIIRMDLGEYADYEIKN